jgi:hypothetical protein
MEAELPQGWRETVEELAFELGGEHEPLIRAVTERLAARHAADEATVGAAARRARHQARRSATVLLLLPGAVVLVLATFERAAAPRLDARPGWWVPVILGLLVMGGLWLRSITRAPFSAMPWLHPRHERDLAAAGELAEVLYRGSLYVALGASPPVALDRAAPASPRHAGRRVVTALREDGQDDRKHELPAPAWLLPALRLGPGAQWSVDTLERMANLFAEERRSAAGSWQRRIRFAALLPLLLCLVPSSAMIIATVSDRGPVTEVALVLVGLVVVGVGLLPSPPKERTAAAKAAGREIWTAATRLVRPSPTEGAASAAAEPTRKRPQGEPARSSEAAIAPVADGAPSSGELAGPLAAEQARTRELVAEHLQAARREGRAATIGLSWLPAGVLVVSELLHPGGTIRLVSGPQVLLLLLALALNIAGVRWLLTISQPPFAAFPSRRPPFVHDPWLMDELTEVFHVALLDVEDGAGPVEALDRAAPVAGSHPVDELLVAVREPGARLSAENPLPQELVEGLRREEEGAVDALHHGMSWIHAERRRTAAGWVTDVRRAALVPFLSCILPAALLLLLAVR